MPFLLVLMQNKSYYVLCAYWVNKVTNQELLRRMGKEQKVIETIKSRKLQFFEHMLRGDKYSPAVLKLETIYTRLKGDLGLCSRIIKFNKNNNKKMSRPIWASQIY
uniref:Uncharacterized protein n=1 Tax=Cacopsylla melanoneura TaxID=428564 RepID=A0A8D8LJF4_9HEMI